MRGDIVRQAGQQLVALVLGHLSAHHRPAQKNLQIHFMVGGVHPGAVIHRVGVDAPAAPGIFDAAELGDAQIGAFAHDLGLDLATIDADGVIGAVANLEMGLGGGLDVGADAAEPQEVGIQFQKRLH
jgi:hypothetical protein